MDASQPVVFVAVLVFKEGKVLLGRRRGTTDGDGQYGTPGGKLDAMETFAQCIDRELKEEVGVEIQNIEFVCLINSFEFAPHHYVGAAFRADWKSGEPENREPEKCSGWDWYDPEALPAPLTSATRFGFDSLKTGKQLFD